MDKHSLVLANAADVRPYAFLHLLWNDFPPLFGTENDVHYVLEIRVRQGVAPPALRILKHLFPALTRWANFSTRLRRWFI
jgi:hypothetical protein